jgi:hypothetical protein
VLESDVTLGEGVTPAELEADLRRIGEEEELEIDLEPLT